MDEAYIYARTGQLVCKPCRELHMSDDFSQAQVKEPMRACMRSGRLLRVTTSDTISWGEICRLRYECYMFSPWSSLMIEYSQDAYNRPHTHMTMTWTLRLESPIGWAEQLTVLLENETVYSCPHLKTHHHELGQAIMRYQEGKRGRVRVVHCPQHPACRTSIHYDLGGKSSWKSRSKKAPAVSISTRRWLWQTSPVNEDPLWIAQTEL